MKQGKSASKGCVCVCVCVQRYMCFTSMRVLSLESWGHRRHETKGGSKVKVLW